MINAFKEILQRSEFSILSTDGQVLQSAQIQFGIRAAVAVLRSQGVGGADRIIFRGDQSHDAFIWFWASISIGAVFVPIDIATTPHQYRWVCGKLNPRLTLSDTDEQDVLIRAVGAGPPILAASCYRGVSSVAQDSVALPSAGQPVSVCLLTSGSTGEPKVVMLSAEALAASAARVCAHFGWQPLERLLNLPAPHTMSGLRNSFIAAPLIGMQWIASPRRTRSDLGSLLALIDRVQAERIVAAPMLIRQINLLKDRAPRSLFKGTRALYCTGADLNPLEVSAFYARFEKPVVNYYGLTESVGVCLTQSVQGWDPQDASVGRPLDCDIRLVGGELWIRQRHPMSGYLDDPEATAEAFHDDWLRTGDMAHLDGQGRVYITGRLASFIKTTQTDRVSPIEVEAVLEQHCNVREAAVCGLPDPAGGERIAALLVAKDVVGSKELQRDIRSWVAEHLGEARVPSLIRWSAAVPRTENGKIQRSRLPGYFDA